jgi:hypothetical protein
MIQRLQTVYFLAIIIICAVSCGGELLSSHQMIPGTVTDYTLNAIYLKTYTNGILVSSEIQYLLIIAVALVIGWTINVIMSYKDRKRQMMLTKINFVMIALLIISLFATAYVKIPEFNVSLMSMKSAFGIALLIFMIYLNLRALMLIRKDEELVRSADRIR